MCLGELFARGFRGLISLETRHEESADQRDDDYWETFVGLSPEKQPVLLRVHCRHSLYCPRDFRILACENIPQTEYEMFVMQKGVLDTPAWNQARKAERDRALRHAAFLDEVAPVCPHCHIPLVPRQNKKDSSRYFGCDNFPDCRETASMPHEVIERLKGSGNSSL